MSAKNLDQKGRWRNKVVAFRVSPEEDAQIEAYVKLSGLTKQDYITNRLLCRDVIVEGSPRVYKALKGKLNETLDQLQRIRAGGNVDSDLLELLEMIAGILGGMKNETKKTEQKNE